MTTTKLSKIDTIIRETENLIKQGENEILIKKSAVEALKQQLFMIKGISIDSSIPDFSNRKSD